jgi:hypothetical protein
MTLLLLWPILVLIVGVVATTFGGERLAEWAILYFKLQIDDAQRTLILKGGQYGLLVIFVLVYGFVYVKHRVKAALVNAAQQRQELEKEVAQNASLANRAKLIRTENKEQFALIRMSASYSFFFAVLAGLLGFLCIAVAIVIFKWSDEEGNKYIAYLSGGVGVLMEVFSTTLGFLYRDAHKRLDAITRELQQADLLVLAVEQAESIEDMGEKHRQLERIIETLLKKYLNNDSQASTDEATRQAVLGPNL